MGDQTSGLLSPFLRARRIAAARPHLGTGPLLDLGCGTGSLAECVPVERYVGVDTDAASLDEARNRFPGHRFLSAAEFESDAGIGPFDRIVSLAVIEHLPDPAGWLQGLSERLTPGGLLVLTTPDPRIERIHALGGRIGLFSSEAAEEHETLFDRAALEAVAAEAGLEVALYHRFMLGLNQLILLRKSP